MIAVDIAEVAIWVVMAPFLAFLLFLALKQQGLVTKSETSIWKQVARELGFELETTKRGLAQSMRGRRRGRDVELGVWHQRYASMDGHAGTRHTSFIVHYETGGPAFEIRPRSEASKLTRSFVSPKDVPPGFESFDQYVDLDADDRDAVVRYLSPIRRAAILGFYRGGAAAFVSHERLEVPYERRFQSVEQVIERIDELIDVADLLCEPAGSDGAR